MMMRVTAALGLMIVFAVSSAAQQTAIMCSAKGAEGKHVSLNTYEDFISFREKEIAVAVVDSTGHFQMSFPLKEIAYAWFSIEYYKGELYLQPGTAHHYNLDGLVFSDETDKQNTNLDPLAVNVQVIDSNDLLNLSVQKLNVAYNKFLLDHIRDMRLKKLGGQIDTFKMLEQRVFSKTGIPYFTTYLNYRFATLDLISNHAGTETIFKQNILDKPVQIDHIEYMDFLSQFFELYLEEVNHPVNLSLLRSVVNIDKSYPLFVETIGRDSLLRNEYLTEVVAILTLRNLYSQPGFSKDNVVGILREAALKSKFEKLKNISSNIVYSLTRFDPGVKAPDFAFPDADGDTVSLHDCEGKYVYLNFFTTWNNACLEEIEFMRTLYPRHSSSVRFISICCDREYMKLYHFSHANKFPWKLLHFNNDYKLLDQYGVKAYPYFVLIDKQGRFISNPAESPSQNIESKLNDVTRKSGTQMY